MCAGFNRKLTNRSARKHMVQRMRVSVCCPTGIMQTSGHENVQSILNYSSISLQTKEEVIFLAGTRISKINESIVSTNIAHNTMQNEIIFISTVSSNSQLEAFLNAAHIHRLQEVSATVNPETVVPPSHFDWTLGRLLLWATMNISNLNVYYTDTNVEK
ncbi:hypothetical protein DPMN_039994 [Dreissena polymorpha]|uniref:Uncharacterized protein n=1 Tax=Dreissena polymorpha TaxID=45954 RepID=A0A9D4CWA4_DREPO|nr:hypothetical protein DPMN_039994 [Dreissena polymorpha]